MSLPMGLIRAFLGAFFLERSTRRVNQLEWNKRRQGRLDARGYRRLVPPAITNPEQRDEPYDMFYRMPKSGELPPRRQGVGRPGTYHDLPLHDVDEPFSFFYREGVSARTRHKLGRQGPMENVPLPISSRKGTINLKAAQTSPSISSHGRRKSYQKTDQRVIKHGGSTASRWDGKIRNTGKKKSWQTAKPHGGPVPESSRRDPYCFLI